MPFYWQLNPDGQTWSAWLIEVAPSMHDSSPKFTTWFIARLQPDGICMSCRKVRGLYYPDAGYYVCITCQRQCDKALSHLNSGSAVR